MRLQPLSKLAILIAPAFAWAEQSQALSPSDLVAVSLDIADRIDFQLGLFITVHLALFGGIIYVDRPLKRKEKVGMLVVYLGFAILSYLFMLGQMALLKQAYADIANFSTHACCTQSNLLTHMASALYDGKLDRADALIMWGHALMLSVVIISVIFDRAISNVIGGRPPTN